MQFYVNYFDNFLEFLMEFFGKLKLFLADLFDFLKISYKFFPTNVKFPISFKFFTSLCFKIPLILSHNLKKKQNFMLQVEVLKIIRHSFLFRNITQIFI